MKMSEKQYALLVKLYRRRKGEVTQNVVTWLENLPPVEASRLIDTWIKKNKWRKSYRDF